MDVITVVLTVIMMGLILFIGALVALKNTITYEAKQLFMSVIINVAVPFIILNSVFNTDLTDDVLHQVILMFICSVSFNVLAVGILLFIWKNYRFFHDKIQAACFTCSYRKFRFYRHSVMCCHLRPNRRAACCYF